MCIYTTNDDHLLLSDPGVGILSCGTRFTAQDNVVALVSYIIHFKVYQVYHQGMDGSLYFFEYRITWIMVTMSIQMKVQCVVLVLRLLVH